MFYSSDLIEKVTSENDIVDVIGESVRLKRSGLYYFGLCPFHNEKSPSFSVSRQKQMFYCFGCHKGGDMLTFLQEYNNMDFSEALHYLADRAGVRLPEGEMSAEQKQQKNERTELYEIYRLAGIFYYCALRDPAGKTGMDYLTERGLTQETIKSFALGYAPAKPSDGLYRYLKQKGCSDDLIKRSGLISIDSRKGSMYDRFRSRVIFPIQDLNSRIIGFGGRIIGDLKPKYLNSPESKIFDKSRNLYGLHLARRSRENCLILCEGYMDVIAMHQAGFTNAVASLGTSLTPGHCALLAKYTKNVVLSYDSDRAGIAAALRAIPMLKRSGITPKILRLDPYKDPDEFLKANTPDDLRSRIETAKNALLFEIEVRRKEFDLSDPEQKTKFFGIAAAKVAELTTEIERTSYADAICSEYAISRRMFDELVTRELMLGPKREPEEDSYYYDPGAPAEYPEETLDLYEDPETGYRYQVPQAPSRKNRSEGTLLEQSANNSRYLLLNYLAKYPKLFPLVKRFITADDFGEMNALPAQLAKLIFAQLEEKGMVEESRIFSHFPEPDDQQKIAQMFHTMPPADTAMEKERAIRETMMKVFNASDMSDQFDFKAIKRKKLLQQELSSLRIEI